MTYTINLTAQYYIDKIREKCEEIKPLVVIQCITYNHDQYIRDALEGFIFQKTTFPFVAIVHEDASTDRTAEVLREYAHKHPDIILPIFENENQYSKGTLGKVMNEACKATGAKYIAFCEGDDYWTDPLKLQKQIDFLESHPDYGMCYAKAREFNQDKGVFIGLFGCKKCTFDEIINANRIPTLTAVLRMRLMNSYRVKVKPENKNWGMGDKPLWLWIALNSKIHFIDDIFGVYRILPESASHTSDFIKWLDFRISALDIEVYFLKNENYPDLLKYEKYSLARYQYMRSIEQGKPSVKYKSELHKYYKFNLNKYSILDLGLLLLPTLSTYIAKKFLFHRNKT